MQKLAWKKKFILLFCWCLQFYFPLFTNVPKKKKLNFKIWKFPKRKEKGKLALTSQRKKKKIQISNFEFQNLKKKKNWWDIFFDELILSQAIEPLSWDPEPRPFQDSSLWAIKPRSEPLSNNSTKPSQDLLQATIRATESLSWDPSYRAEIQTKLSWAAFWDLFCYQTQGFTKITHWVWGEVLRNKFHIPYCLDVFIIIYSCPINRTSHKYCKHTERILIKI